MLSAAHLMRFSNHVDEVNSFWQGQSELFVRFVASSHDIVSSKHDYHKFRSFDLRQIGFNKWPTVSGLCKDFKFLGKVKTYFHFKLMRITKDNCRHFNWRVNGTMKLIRKVNSLLAFSVLVFCSRSCFL